MDTTGAVALRPRQVCGHDDCGVPYGEIRDGKQTHRYHLEPYRGSGEHEPIPAGEAS